MVNDDYEEVTEMDLIFEAHDKIDALIELLIETGVISQESYEKKLEEIFNRNEEDYQE